MFKGNDSVLAIDVGSAAIKWIELGIEGGKPLLRRAASVDLPMPPDGERGEGRPETLPRLVSALGDLMSDLGVKASKVKRLVTSLPGPRISIKQIKSLALPDEEMRSALVFEARKHMPIEGDVLMDYQVLGKRGDEIDVLLVVTSKQAVTSHLSMLEACGLTSARHSIIEAPALALWNAYLHRAGSKDGALGLSAEGSDKMNRESSSAAGHLDRVTDAVGSGMESSPFALLNVGASTTQLSFFHRQGLFLTRDIPIAGDRFTDDIRQQQGLDFAAAEKVKTEGRMFRNDGRGAHGATAVLELEGEGGHGQPSLQALVRELQRSIRFYLKESGQSRLGRMVLTGGGATDPGLKEHFERELGMQVEVFDPIAGMEKASGIKVEGPQRFAQAVGMGLRGLHEFFPHQLK